METRVRQSFSRQITVSACDVFSVTGTEEKCVATLLGPGVGVSATALSPDGVGLPERRRTVEKRSAHLLGIVECAESERGKVVAGQFGRE